MNLSIEILGLTLTTIGELLLAGTVLAVHEKIKKDHKIDEAVIKEISIEHIMGILAIVFIILGFFFQINFFQHFKIN